MGGGAGCEHVAFHGPCEPGAHACPSEAEEVAGGVSRRLRDDGADASALAAPRIDPRLVRHLGQLQWNRPE